MSDVFQIYECAACHEVAIVNGPKRDGILVHGRSPGGTTRCGGILVHCEERGRCTDSAIPKDGAK